ncbi:ATP-binding protein [Chloroflexota bacterium]
MRDILSDPIYLYSPLLVALCSLVLAVVVFRWGKKDVSSRIFTALLLSLTLWAAVLYAMRSSQNLHNAMLWEKAIPASTLLTFILFYHFTLIYTNVDQLSKQWKLIPLSYAFLLILIVLSPTSLMIESMRLEHYGYAPNTRILGKIVFLAYVLLISGGAYNFIKRYRATTSYAERNRLSYLLIATVCVLVGMALDCFSNLPPLALWSNLLFAVICSITVIRYRLLDISIAIRQGSVYLIVSSIIAIPYLLVLFYLHVLTQGFDIWWINVLVVLIAAAILRPLYTWAQQFMDRLFYRKRYDHLIALENFMHETHDISDFNNLISYITKHIQPVLQSASVNLLLATESRDYFTERQSSTSYEQGLSLSKGSALVKWMEANKSPLYLKEVMTVPQLQYLTQEERIIIDKTEADFFMPLFTRANELLGLIVLGKKLSGMEYSKEEERLVLATANRVAGIIENAYLFDSEKNLAERLKKEGDQKTEFLHNVAHELKTPLTAMIASSEILDEEQVSSGEYRKRLISNIRNSAKSMDKRVSELLDIARIQTGVIVLRKEPIYINELLSNVALQIQPIFEEKNQMLKLEIPDILPKINADSSRLEQVLYNLLTNANKFSPVSSDVILRAKVSSGQVVVEVEDSAPVISKEDSGKIFEPYYRSGDSAKREHQAGLGLGLSIAKYLIELHQGQMWFESGATKGNTFIFSLPALDQEPKESDDQQTVT